MGDERVSHEFETIGSLCGKGKTLVVGWWGSTFFLFFCFSDLGVPLFLAHDPSILLQGPTEAMLVDFLLSLRADVKGVMRRIASTIRRYDLSSSALTVSASSSLDASGFAELSNSAIKNNEEQVTLSEVSYFLKSTGGGRRQARHNTNVQTKDITMLFCRSIINLGLSIQGRGQQKNRRVWVLVRRKALHLVDSELDQLLDENEEEEKRRRERRRVMEEGEEEEEARGASKMESPSSRSSSSSSKVLPITPIVMNNLKQVRERRERLEEPPGQRGQREQPEQQQHSLNVTPIVVQRKKMTSSFGKK